MNSDWFRDAIGLSELDLNALNGFVKIRETEDECEFRFNPVNRIDRVKVVRMGDDACSITCYRSGIVSRHRPSVPLHLLPEILEDMTGVLFF